MRVAAIDIGTNTVLLLIADRNDRSELTAVADLARITRLGQGVDRTRMLAIEAVERTLACLREYASEISASKVDAIGVVGTSAMRDATSPASERGGSFIERAREILGVAPRVVSGAEEADLAFSGGLLGLGLSGEVTAFDVGGGSTELIRGMVGGESAGAAPGVCNRMSLDIGSVRLFERHIRSDPPSAMEMSIVSSFAADQLLGASAPPPGMPLVGMAGTVTTLAAIARGIGLRDPAEVHGMRLSAQEIADTTRMLIERPLAERVRLAGLDPRRADVIPVGAALVRAIVAWASSDEIIVSDRGVRWGIAERLMQGTW